VRWDALDDLHTITSFYYSLVPYRLFAAELELVLCISLVRILANQK